MHIIGEKRCGDMLPDLLDGKPADRTCLKAAQHDGDHNDGTVLWSSAESEAVRSAVKGLEDGLVADAPRAARVAVLGAADGAAKGIPALGGPNRAERRKHLHPVK